MMAMMGPRYFSTTAAVRSDQTAAMKLLTSHVGGVPSAGLFRFPIAGVRYSSTATVADVDEKKPETGSAGGGGPQEKGIVSYWGVQPRKVVKEDGTEWRWSCFMV